MLNKTHLGPVEDALENAIRSQILPCAVLMIAGRDGVLYSKSLGQVGEHSIFHVQSMVKAIVATAAMQLVEKGLLDLDQDIGDLLPPLRNIQVLDGFDANGEPRLRRAHGPIKLSHLLTHTSGVTDTVWSSAQFRYEVILGNPVEYGTNNWPTNMVLNFDPGTRWQYGLGFGWVGKAIEAVTSRPLFDYLKDNIFDPLGMVDTVYELTEEQRNRVAPAFVRKSDGKGETVVFPDADRPDFHHGNGDIFSSPADYLIFLRMLLNEGAWNDNRILKADTVKLMRQNHIGALNVSRMIAAQPDLTNDVDFFPGMHHKWGISFDINPEKGPNGRNPGSFGWGGGPNLYYWVDPTAGIASIFMTQVRPFFDAQSVALFGYFERQVYGALA